MTTPALRRVVLDTDTYNEIDDQFALAHLLLSPEIVKLEAVHAAPFFNNRSTGPGDGMEKSYEEIYRVLDLVQPKERPAVFRGSTTYLPDATTPVKSEAVNDLIARAMATKDDKLIVIAIAAATNVASALLAKPEIAEKIVIVWLGGHAPYWPHTKEFNLQQDLHSARVLFNSNAPLVLVPCWPVASHLTVTVPELEKQLAPHSKLGKYLTDIVRGYGNNAPGWSKCVWDIGATAWAINEKWLQIEDGPAPILRDDVTWDPAPGKRRIQIVRQIDRDGIFADFYNRAKKAP